MSEWHIKSIVRGRIRGAKSILIQSAAPDEQFWFPSTVYYLTDGDRHVLVDTSFGDPATVAPTQPAFDLEADQSFRDCLAEHAVPPAEIDTVVVSHLHWDHAGNVDLFDDTSTEIRAQREAVQYAYAPLDIHTRGYLTPSAGFDPPWLETSFAFIDGDATLAPGLRAVHTPGHSPGHTSLLAETGAGTVALALDVAPLAANIEADFVPPGCTNVHDWWASATRLREAADTIVPSHDPDATTTGWITAPPDG